MQPQNAEPALKLFAQQPAEVDQATISNAVSVDMQMPAALRRTQC
jgi:hypothetical protein